MTGFDAAFHATTTFASPTSFEDFRKQIEPAWIEQALAATGTATVRRRRLPSEQVVWVVLGMALYRDRPLEDIVTKLDLVMPGVPTTIARSSVSQARERVGSAPMKWLFERCASVWAERSAETHRWRGLRVYGLDGSTIRVPDTPENRAEFGGQNGREGTPSGYPLVRLAVLMVLRSHLVAAANFGRYERTSEHHFARPLVQAVPDHSLLIMDKGYFAAALLLGVEREHVERHWLTRARVDLRARVVERLGAGDEIVEMKVSKDARNQDPTLPRVWQARRIRYEIEAGKPQNLLTSLRDAKRYPAAEIVALYHERWEIELGYDEIKTELLDREEAIRSKKPETVRQEIWGVLVAYNLVRLEMEHIAREAKVPPTQISFVESLRLIRDEWWWSSTTSPGAIPKRLATMRRNIKRYILPPRRPRRYPRAVKIKMSNYHRKRPVTAAPK